MCKTDVYKAKCPKCKGAWQVKETVHPMCKEAAKAKPPQRVTVLYRFAGGSVCANEDVHSSPVVSHDVHAASRVADRALISWPVFSGLGNDDEREKKYLPLPTARAGTLNGQRATDESKEAAKREQVQSASRTCPLPVTACQSPVLRSSLSCRAPDGAQSAEGAGLRLGWISPPVNLVRALQVDALSKCYATDSCPSVTVVTPVAAAAAAAARRGTDGPLVEPAGP
ncbi:hypothetical protein PCL_12449 [Purpureocillium lilacinum]|uniref:Uncharacterized protein n=1 Tax=Purpureocillium lilacinum TaxID=33203 RepID=A0A2U3E9A1_PURLI|nr:hypothetical protein PCL_12449 [Purpureocillium lilacinum]